jgi:hypothetical protein
MPPLHNPRNWNSHNEFELPSFAHAHEHIHCMCDQITTDSQTVPFTCYLNWVSTGSDMYVVNRGESLVACEFIDCELINN